MFKIRIALALIAYLTCFSAFAASNTETQITTLEKSINGKIGVYAIDTNTNKIISHRGNERLPIQSTFKLMGVGALLHQADVDNNLLNKQISYLPKDVISWSPVTKLHIKTGMTLSELSQATISYSDNTAINLIMRQMGGPKAVTEFAHSIGNQSFNVSHYEANLNSNPNSTEDTATPKDMAMSLQRLTLGDVLSTANRQQLVKWMQNNTTGNKRIRTGVPIGWHVAEKTGSGTFGVANDIGIMWSPGCGPIVLAVYTVSYDKGAKWRDDVIAKTTSLVFEEFAKTDNCMDS